jgi:acetyl esterase/lipase
MSLDQLNMLLAGMAANPPPQGGPLELRTWFAAAHEPIPCPAGLEIVRVAAGPAGGDLITPPGAAKGGLIIYYHGGGFVFGSSRTHRVVAGNLARAAGVAVLAADYRLAPEHPAPAAHDDAYSVYVWALENGYSPERIALAGDSAGGNLALATAVRARDAGKPVPAALALMSPALDFAGEGESYRTVDDDPIISPPLMELFLGCYLGGGDRRSPAVTPFAADLAGLAPTLVHVGTRERLRDDAVTIVARLRAAGVPAELEIWEGMIHSMQIYAPMLDEGMASVEAAAAFLRGHVERS